MNADSRVNISTPDPADVLARLRILDANANRAGEGLRVVEEFARFVLDDRHLTELLKRLRHELTQALAVLPPHERLAARDTQADVGTTITTATEAQRADVRAVARANLRRVEEALRCLEEFAKGPYPTLAAAGESLRYQLYTVARALEAADEALSRLADCRLYVLIDGGRDTEDFERRVAVLVAAGVDILQLRDKRRGDREMLDLARRLRRHTDGSRTRFIMNDRPDLARLAHADGVHVGQEELSVRDVRQIVGPSALVGVSTHSIEQARRAVLDGASYIGCGPVFPSATKSFGEYVGVEYLRQVNAEIRLPAFAIGGITLERLPEVLAAGFQRVAVSDAIWNATDPAGAVKAFQNLLASS